MFTEEQLVAIEEQRKQYALTLSEITNKNDLDQAWQMFISMYEIFAGEFDKRAAELSCRCSELKFEGKPATQVSRGRSQRQGGAILEKHAAAKDRSSPEP